MLEAVNITLHDVLVFALVVVLVWAKLDGWG